MIIPRQSIIVTPRNFVWELLVIKLLLKPIF